jgi:type I restriction-modification system DNA methylase subunit
MFKAGTVASLTSAQSLVQDTQKDVNKEGTIDHKERNSTTRSAWKLNVAHHEIKPLVEIQILHFLLLFFDIFLILYDLNIKHTNFQLNWTEGVA